MPHKTARVIDDAGERRGFTAAIDLEASWFQIEISSGATYWVTRDQLRGLPPFVRIVASVRLV